MSAILIVCILVAGYYYLEKTPTEKIKFKRSNNWEAYVILVKHGLFYMMFGVLLTLILLMLVGILLLKSDKFSIDFLFSYMQLIYSKTSLGFWQVAGGILSTCAFVFSLIYLVVREQWFNFLLILKSWLNNVWASNNDLSLNEDGGMSQSLPKEKRRLLKQLKNQDGLLWIALESMEKSTTVKISLKSKKIYVGLVHGEQFERMDFDNLIILPYLSGYRDKDTLRFVVNVNYADFYKQHGVFDSDKWYENEAVTNFQLGIRVGEIESISFFDVATFNKMKENQENQDKSKSNILFTKIKNALGNG